MEIKDLHKLDELAKTNGTAKQRMIDEMLNLLRAAGSLFDYVTEVKIRAIVERLVSENIGSYQLKHACDYIISNYEKFPSYKAIKEACYKHKPKDKIQACINCCEGIMSVYHKKTGINYAFRCECAAGDQYRSYQPWNTVNVNYFTRLAPSKLSLDGKENPYLHLKKS